MTPEQQKSIDQTAAERAASFALPPKPVTIDDLHQRIIALENHPALAPKEESNG